MAEDKHVVLRVSRSDSDGDKAISVKIRKDGTVDDLLAEIIRSLPNGYRVDNICLFYASQPLRAGTKLEAYTGLTDYQNSGIVMGVEAPGGSQPLKENKRTLTPLPGFIKVTTTGEDVISLVDSTDELKAMMPCHHILSPDSMRQYCHSLLKDNIFTFPCPVDGCEAVWDYFMVRHVALLTTRERLEFESKLSAKYMMASCGFRECPGCKVLCCRADKRNIRVRCAVCAQERGKHYEFCWVCQREWKTGGTTECGNSGCDGKDPRLRTLRNAPLKKITVGLHIDGVPSVRSCPKCGILIYHSTGCRHMTCVQCKTLFCFICLKLQKCGLYSKCEVAPRQTSIVGE